LPLSVPHPSRLRLIHLNLFACFLFGFKFLVYFSQSFSLARMRLGSFVKTFNNFFYFFVH